MQVSNAHLASAPDHRLEQGANYVIDDLFDTARPTKQSWFTLALVAAVTIADGADIASISVVAPLIVKQYGLPHNILGVLLSGSLMGMLVASFLLSPVADRIGRRPATIVGLSVACVTALLSLLAPTWHVLFMLQIAGGLGIGLTTPSVYALIAEVFPTRMRAMGTVVGGTGIALGMALSSLLVGYLVNVFGYRSAFIVSSGLLIVVVATCSAFLPESPFFLVRKKASIEQLIPLLRRFGADVPDTVTAFGTRDKDSKSGRIQTLLAREYRATTLLLWLASLCTALILYMANSWMVALLDKAGEDLGLALRFFSLSTFISAALSIGVAWLTTKLQATYLLMTGYVIVALAGLSLGLFAGVQPGFYAVLFALMLINPLLMFLVIGVTTRYFGSEIRATALGYCLGATRLGAVLGPITGGLLVSMGLSINAFFATVAIPSILALLSIARLVFGDLKQDRGTPHASSSAIEA